MLASVENANGELALNPSPSVARVDGQRVSVRNVRETLDRIRSLLRANEGFSVYTLNLDHLVKRRNNASFRDAYSRATVVSADGWPVVHLARRDDPKVERTTGADLVVPLCGLASEVGAPVYLFGSTGAVLKDASDALCALYPRLRIVGYEAPARGFDPTSDAGRSACRRIGTSEARICFVALGAPKQELFADLVRTECPRLGLVCIGAALDFIAGAQTRAPVLLQKLNLEWAWRVAREPKRLTVRYVRCGLLFLELLLRRGVDRPEQTP